MVWWWFGCFVHHYNNIIFLCIENVLATVFAGEENVPKKTTFFSSPRKRSVRRSIEARGHARSKQPDKSGGGSDDGDDNDADNPSAAHSLIGEKICRRHHRRRAVTQFY